MVPSAPETAWHWIKERNTKKPYTTTNHEWFWYNKVLEVVTWEDPATGKEVLASPAQPVTSGPSEPAVTAAGAAAGDRSEGTASTDEAVQVDVDTAPAVASTDEAVQVQVDTAPAVADELILDLHQY